jgi:hypothetical protein
MAWRGEGGTASMRETQAQEGDDRQNQFAAREQ